MHAFNMCMYIHIYMSAYIHAYVDKCIYHAYTQTQVPKCKHPYSIYAYTCIHVYIYTHIYMYIYIHP